MFVTGPIRRLGRVRSRLLHYHSMKRSCLSFFVPAAASLLAAAFQPSAFADSITYTGTATQGKWNVASNWTPATVPVNGDDVFLIQSGSRNITVDLNQTYNGAGLASLFINADGAGTMTLNTSRTLVVSGDETIGSFGKGAFNQNSGKHTAGQILLAASDIADLGTYVLKKGSLSVLTNLSIGVEGQGVFTQRSGSVGVGGDLVLADNFFAQASYSLNNGSLSVVGANIVGEEGVAYFTQSRGKVSQGALVVGSASSGLGSVTMSNGRMNSGSVIVGDDGIGEFVQYRGTHNVAGDLSLGATSGSGEYKIAGGSLSVGGNLNIGPGGTGSFEQTGGKVTITGGLAITSGGYSMTDSSLTTNGITIDSGASFSTSGTSSRVRTTEDILIADGGSADFSAAELIIGKNSEVTFSVIGSFDDGLAVRKLTLERNITLSLEGSLGNALVVDVFDIGTNNVFRLDSIVFGNGIDIYYNGDNAENRYLLGLSYDLGNGGRLIPIFSETTTTTLGATLSVGVNGSYGNYDTVYAGSASGTLSDSSYSTVGAVPEPSTVLLAGSGLAALLLRRRRAGR